MLSAFAKILLVLTSLSPALGAVAISQFTNDQPWIIWGAYLVVGLFLIIVCWALLGYAEKNVQKHNFSIEQFDRKDQEMLAFLFIYLFPFLRVETFAGGWLISVYVLIIVTVAIVYTGAFHFNPVMRLLGYRFYAVKNSRGTSQLLISKKDLRNSETDIQAVRLALDVYLYVEETHA